MYQPLYFLCGLTDTSPESKHENDELGTSTRHVRERHLDVEQQNFHAVLELVNPPDSRESETPPAISDLLLSGEKVSRVQEGMFVTIGEDGVLEDASGHAQAIACTTENILARSRLKRRRSKAAQFEMANTYNAFSYHVNVGHGNCSLLLFCNHGAVKIYMIDCSDYDFTSKTSYRNNIRACIDHIEKRFKITFKIDKLFLTHTHYDHYSGIRWLCSNKYLNGAEVWLNVHYAWPSPAYNSCLKALHKAKVRIVEPISSNSVPGIDIWHPEGRVIRKRAGVKKGTIEAHPNLASAVLQFKVGNKKFLFPGDIETKGWEKIEKCMGVNASDYFCISHHGSLNGHLRKCSHGGATSVRDCVSSRSRAVLMGKDKAYPGIFDRRVLGDFKDMLIKAEATPCGREASFVVINLRRGRRAWAYPLEPAAPGQNKNGAVEFQKTGVGGHARQRRMEFAWSYCATKLCCCGVETCSCSGCFTWDWAR